MPELPIDPLQILEPSEVDLEAIEEIGSIQRNLSAVKFILKHLDPENVDNLLECVTHLQANCENLDMLFLRPVDGHQYHSINNERQRLVSEGLIITTEALKKVYEELRFTDLNGINTRNLRIAIGFLKLKISFPDPRLDIDELKQLIDSLENLLGVEDDL